MSTLPRIPIASRIPSKSSPKSNGTSLLLFGAIGSNAGGASMAGGVSASSSSSSNTVSSKNCSAK